MSSSAGAAFSPSFSHCSVSPNVTGRRLDHASPDSCRLAGHPGSIPSFTAPDSWPRGCHAGTFRQTGSAIPDSWRLACHAGSIPSITGSDSWIWGRHAGSVRPIRSSHAASNQLSHMQLTGGAWRSGGRRSGRPQSVRCAAGERPAGPSTEQGGLVVSFGEMLIDFVPTVAGVSLAEAPAFEKAPGGAPANVAAGIARLGGSAAFIGKVGDDEFGHMLAHVLEKAGVCTKGMRFDTGARTALAFVTLRADGEREFMFYRNPSADMLLQAEELDTALIESASVFHFGSISLIHEPCRSAHLAAVKAAQEAGVLLSFDPNLRLPLWPSAERAREEILGAWPLAQVIKVSDEELEFLLPGRGGGDEAALSLVHPGLRLLLVTEGERGCRYYTQTFRGQVPGFGVRAVDTTGAGDAFVAAMLAQLSKDRSLLEDESRLREALRFANAAGALTTTQRGAIPALPTPEAVKALLDSIAP